jgi:hypothetical protein
MFLIEDGDAIKYLNDCKTGPPSEDHNEGKD